MALDKGKLKTILTRELSTMYLAGFFELATVMISFTLIPLYIREAGGGNFDIGLQTTLFTLFSVLFRFFLGPMADRRGRKLPLVLGSIVFATTPPAIYFSPTLGIMALARVYQALGMATFLSAATSYIADKTPDSLRGTTIGIYRTAVTLSVMIPPAVGMVLINRYGFPLFFVYMTALGAAGTILVLSLPGKICVRSEAERIGPRELFALFGIPALRGTYTGIFALSMAIGILLTFLTGYASAFPVLRNPALYYTIHAGAGALGATLLGSLSDRFGRDRLLPPVLLFLTAGLLLLVFVDRSPRLFYYTAALFTGVGASGGLALMVARVIDAVPSRMRASALAFQESAIDGGNALGIFLFGLALTAAGYPRLFGLLALFVLVMPAALMLSAGFRKRGLVRG